MDNLATEYQRTNDESVFRELYDLASANWPTLIPKLARKYYLDESDVCHVANVKLFELSRAYDRTKGSFANMLGQAIRRGCIDLIRKNKRRDAEYLTDNYSLIEPFTDTCNAETECIEYLQKKYDQRQLVEALLEHADDYTRQCVSAYLAENDSYTNAAKRLGTTRKTVRRRITSLARHFDGEYHDYFTVPTTNITKTISA